MSARPALRYLPGVAALALCLPAWWIDARLAWVAYLAAWWFCAGCAMGGLVNVWIHNITGGEWGEAIRDPLLALSRAVPLLALLFVPVLLGMGVLYPWAHGAASDARWAGELSRPEFKRAWLEPTFFVVRSVAYLAMWVVLAAVTQRTRWRRSRRWSAAALLLYAMTTTFAAIDWLMSLVPLWHSTTFGLLALTGNGLAGACFGVAAAAYRTRTAPSVFRDLGNLLLTYVLVWAYLAFTQYLIIWAGNLPHEIVWYVARLQSSWSSVGVLLVAGHFFVPLLVLLSRGAKRVPLFLGGLAAALLAMHLVDAWWLTVPSVRAHSAHVLWVGPLAALAMIALIFVPAVHRWEATDAAAR